MAFEAKLWDGDEWNMKRKRFVAWGIIALVILIPAFLTIDKHRGYHPRMLEEMLSPMSGSLLANDSSQFGIPGFEYGEDFPTTVKMLDLQEWFTEERIDSILGELEQAKGSVIRLTVILDSTLQHLEAKNIPCCLIFQRT